ncbi:MAG: RagB/SusD family nutrient uptake outer membrane protein [Bacteroidales bacterium]|nr:RagB/SusD family nutrient uptake outer membrane protein [Bacteroidales bacterium]
MKKNIGYIYCILAFASCAMLSSCENYLDKAPEEDILIEDAFLKRNYAEAFLSDAYADLPLENYFTDMADINPFVLASDEFNVPWPEKFGKLMNRGALNAYNTTGRVWINMYEGIRKCNIFLDNIDRTPVGKDFSQKEKDTWVGEAILLRAIYHFFIIRVYGPCIIMDHSVTVNDDFNALQRKPLDECIQFVLDEMDKAIALLPAKIEDSSKIGRVTSALAYAVKARLLLYRASDLWNGNPLYKDYTGSDKPDAPVLFPQVKDASWWKKAADAAKECIDFCENNGYHLYRSADNDPVKNYQELFTVKYNPEIIYSRQGGRDGNMEKASYPRSLGGWGGFNPTQAIVDMYEMADGSTPITGYNNDGSPIINTNSGYTEDGFAAADDPDGRWVAGVSNMYVNREPRFYASINFNGAVFKGHQIELWKTGADGQGNEGRDYCTTGYLLKKHANPDCNIPQGIFQLVSWPLFRLGEVYLNYAEALNEAEGPIDDVYKYVNAIRDRSGLPGLPSGLNKDQMRERIRHERQIELSFETHRYFDCHRWMIAQQTESGPVYGMNIAAGTSLQDPEYYKRTVVEIRVFPYPQYYLFPIYDSEINKIDGLAQNPYW